MARKPKHKELDLYDYSGVITGSIKIETNNEDKIGRHLEEVIANQCDAKLDLFDEPDLPEVGVGIKTGNYNVKQTTVGTISHNRFSDMSEDQRYEWFKKHTEHWHYVDRYDELGLTGGSYNINAAEGSHGGELYKEQFEQICRKIDNTSKVDLDTDPRNWPRLTSDDKGMWGEYNKNTGSWRIRISKKNRRTIEKRDNTFDKHFNM